MVFYINSEHPKDLLLFYVAGRCSGEQVARVGAWIDSLASERPWVIHAPYFVHQEEELVDPETGRPVMTVGGVMEMYTAHGSWRTVLPREVDEAHFEECLLVVRQLARLSSETGLHFHLEFQGELVGEIAHGTMDERLEKQFLRSWAMGLGRSI